MGAPDTAPLRAECLANLMAASLPKRAGPQIKNAYEAIALAVHAGMIAVGFKLIGLGEDHKIGEWPASPFYTFLDRSNSCTETHSELYDMHRLPTEWNEQSSYAFRYSHPQSAMEFILKINRLGGKAVVFGIAVGDDRTTNFDVTVKDYLSESSLPLDYDENTSTEDARKIITEVFISEGRLSDLGALLKVSVLQKLAPGIQKEGYEEERQQDRDADRAPPQGIPRGEPRQPGHPPANEPEPARPYPIQDPLAAPPRGGNRPLPEPIPGFEDEYEINRPPHGGLRDDRFAPGIGHNDLYPPGLGPNDPIRPHFGGGNVPRPGGMGGGMHPTFDDPLFQGQGGQGGYDPQAPPGARYDPVGPGDPLRDNRGGPRFPGGGGGFARGGGFGGGLGGAPGNPFGGFGGGDFI